MVVWQVQRQIIFGDEHATKNATDVSKISNFEPTTPVAKRTRAQTRRHLKQAATPTPAPRPSSISLSKQTASLSLQSKGGDVVVYNDTRAIGSANDLSNSDNEEEEDDEDDSGENSPTLSLHFIQIYVAGNILGQLLCMCFKVYFISSGLR